MAGPGQKVVTLNKEWSKWIDSIKATRHFEGDTEVLYAALKLLRDHLAKVQNDPPATKHDVDTILKKIEAVTGRPVPEMAPGEWEDFQRWRRKQRSK